MIGDNCAETPTRSTQMNVFYQVQQLPREPYEDGLQPSPLQRGWLIFSELRLLDQNMLIRCSIPFSKQAALLKLRSRTHNHNVRCTEFSAGEGSE